MGNQQPSSVRGPLHRNILRSHILARLRRAVAESVSHRRPLFVHGYYPRRVRRNRNRPPSWRIDGLAVFGKRSRRTAADVLDVTSRRLAELLTKTNDVCVIEPHRELEN